VLRSVDGRGVNPIGPITGGWLEVGRDGQWNLRVNWRGDLGNARTYGDRGTLLRRASTLTFVSNDNGDALATVQSAGITLDYYWPVDSKVRRLGFARESLAPGPPPNLSRRSSSALQWSSLSAGARHACGLTTAGAVYCWGLRAQPAGSAGGDRPERADTDVAFTSISTGNALCPESFPEQGCFSRYHVCALTASGEAYCFGSNQFGQLGDGTTNDTATFRPVNTRARFAMISAGYGFTCGVTTTGELLCWGDNDSSELGRGPRDKLPHPVPQRVGTGVSAVSAARQFACALSTAGLAYCWGTSSTLLHRAGYNTTPAPVETERRFVSLTASESHICALTRSGDAYCWGGENNFSQAGPGDSRGLARTPMPVPGLVASSIATGARHTCAIALDGTMSCWGANNFGQLGAVAARHCGIGDIPCTATPLPVATGERFRAVTAGDGFSCGIVATGQALCWGDNTRGQLGTGTREPRRAPSEVSVPSTP